MADELILVEKDGEQIRVHPLSLPNHLELGWKVVEATPPAEETPAEPKKAPGKKASK